MFKGFSFYSEPIEEKEVQYQIKKYLKMKQYLKKVQYKKDTRRETLHGAEKLGSPSQYLNLPDHSTIPSTNRENQ